MENIPFRLSSMQGIAHQVTCYRYKLIQQIA